MQADRWDPDYFDCELILELNTISESYYNWGSYLWQYEDGLLVGLGDLGLGDPVWAYSNVSTGAGVVAARSVATYTIKLKDFLEKTMLEFRDNAGQ